MVTRAPYAYRLAIGLQLFEAAVRCEQLAYALAGGRIIQTFRENFTHVFERCN